MLKSQIDNALEVQLTVLPCMTLSTGICVRHETDVRQPPRSLDIRLGGLTLDQCENLSCKAFVQAPCSHVYSLWASTIYNASTGRTVCGRKLHDMALCLAFCVISIHCGPKISKPRDRAYATLNNVLLSDIFAVVPPTVSLH